MTASSAAHGSIDEVHGRLAERLAPILRDSRLTLLLGAAGSGKSALLTTGLIPLLSRRVSDRPTAPIRREGGVIYLPERRRNATARDVVIRFDQWDDAPLSALGRAIDDALLERFASPPTPPLAEMPGGWLAGKLVAASRQFGVRFLFVLDAFDVFLAAPEDEPGIAVFAEELIDAINAPELAANFLIALRDDAEPAFERIGTRVGQHAEVSIRLPSRREARATTTLHAVDPGSPARGRVPGTVATSSAPESPEPGDRADVAVPPASAARRSRRVRNGSVAALVVVLCGAIGWIAGSRWGEPRSSVASQAIDALASGWRSVKPEPTAPVVPVHAAFDLEVDPDSAVDVRMAVELRDRVAREAGIDLRVRPADGRESSGDRPRLAILRYDALRTARSGARSGEALPRLQIVAPLHTETILILARRDAPIAAIHEIAGRRINTGPAASARGMTATRLYRDLFDAPLPVGEATYDDEATALAKLVEGRGVDAMVVTSSDLDALFADRPADWKTRVKLLGLDRSHPSTRRAQRFFLSTTVPAQAGAGLLRADLPALSELAFLVATSPLDDRHAAGLGDLARGLCAGLPGLQRDGDPKWREVHVGTRFDVGWPYVREASDAFAGCSSPSVRRTASTSR